jgi:hypothetical protein
MTNYVRTIGQQIVSNVVKRALGGRGSGSNNSSDFKNLHRTGSTSTKGVGHGAGHDIDSYDVLAFPLDVVSSDPNMGNHGHYIQFFVNVQKAAQIKFGEKSSGRDNLSELTKQFNIPDYVKRKTSYEKKYLNADWGLKVGVAKHLINQDTNFLNTAYNFTKMSIEEKQLRGITDEQFNSTTDPYESFRMARAPTIRSKMCINMYMPAQVQASYNANYTDTSMGALTTQAMRAFDQLMAKNWDGAGATVANMSEAGKEMLTQLLTTTIGTIGPAFGGLEVARQAREGKIITEKMELAFKGVPKRNFSYTFKMMPRSQTEMEEVRKIVKAFKSNMLPELTESYSRKLVVPNTFNIQYMYVNNVNNYLHNIGECVLETMNVTYGGDRYKTFTAVPGEGAPPVETTMTLNFKEFHFLTRNDVENEGM